MANPILLRTDNIGAPDAESDSLFLQDSFVDTGAIDPLLDCQNPQCILLGRTGAGKTAIIQEIIKGERVVGLAPETLSLNFLTNSSVINFFEEAGVHLDAFYKLLWQHVFAVELLKLKYGITNEQKQRDFITRLADTFLANAGKKAAYQYLEQWGSRFWLETAARVQEFTRKLEHQLSADVKISPDLISLGAKGARNLTEEQRTEIVSIGQQAVSKVHIQDLHNLVESLNTDIFDDPKKPYYLVIDRLDENWVDEKIRHKLIRSLIEAVRAFRKIRNVKVLVALRNDLLFSVLTRTSQPGFQAEKFESLYHKIHWTRETIEKALDLRVSSLFRRKYTSDSVKIRDILPGNQIDRRDALDHILDRTFMRPRDAIIFVNECISRAAGRTRIGLDNLKAAESSYSQKRLESIYHEWGFEYPCIKTTTKVLMKKPNRFVLADISTDQINALAYEIATNHSKAEDPIKTEAEKLYNKELSPEHFIETVFMVLYQVGLIGVKLATHQVINWSHLDQPTLERGVLNESTPLFIHKTFWAVLNIHPKEREIRTS